MSKRNLTSICLLLAFVLLPQRGRAEDYPIPAHGALQIVFPKGWKISSRSLAQPPTLALAVTPEDSMILNVQITTVWLDAAALEQATAERRRGDMEKSGREMLSQAVEKTLAIQELRGAQSNGFYYALTDRAPGPGEHKYLIQGSLLTGPALSVFTILYRSPGMEEVNQVLKALSTAAYSAR